ncbi:Deoxyribonuclease-1-like 2 [Balamuthia mandrillaris]
MESRFSRPNNTAGLLSMGLMALALLSMAVFVHGEPFRLGSFNIQQMGDTKILSGRDEVVNVIVSTLLRFDIIFIQELQNGPNDACGQYTGPAICALLAAMNELSDTPYGLNVGPRANGVEQYAILYKEHIFSVEESFPYSPAETFARTPQVVLMKHKPSGNQFWSINIHTQPTKAREEIQALTDVVASLSLDVTDMVVVLGDFNSDGSYFSERKGWPLFFAALGDGWMNAIHDDMDTTVAHSDNTYDRIVLSPSLAETLIPDSAAVFYYDDPSQGGFSMSAIQEEGCAKKYISQCPATVNEAASKVSDHYPVEVFLDFGGSAASSGSSSKSNGTNDHDHQKQEGEDDEHHQQSGSFLSFLFFILSSSFLSFNVSCCTTKKRARMTTIATKVRTHWA